MKFGENYLYKVLNSWKVFKEFVSKTKVLETVSYHYFFKYHKLRNYFHGDKI